MIQRIDEIVHVQRIRDTRETTAQGGFVVPIKSCLHLNQIARECVDETRL